MHIGVDLRCLLSPHRTGVGEYTFELLTAILNSSNAGGIPFAGDSENHYYLFYNSFLGATPILPNFTGPNVHLLRTSYPNKLFNFAIKIFKYPKLDSLIAKKFELSHLDYFFSPHLNFTCLSSKTKHILTVHDLTYDLFPEFLTTKQRWWHRLTSPKKQCENAQLILTPSENTKRDIINYYHIAEDKIRVIYPGLSSVSPTVIPSAVEESLSPTIGESDFSTSLRFGRNDKFNLPNKFILFLGTLEPRKNIAGLITAYESAFQNFNAPHDLVIAGAPGWKNEEVKALARRSPLHDKIHFLGFIEENDKPTLYRAASVFVYPSFYEGFGFPVLEAMQNGTPVITSNRSSLPEITSGAAYLVNPHRSNEIAHGLTKILNSSALAERFSILGKTQAEKFSWGKSALDWLNLLK